jgi:hypothetical protein
MVLCFHPITCGGRNDLIIMVWDLYVPVLYMFRGQSSQRTCWKLTRVFFLMLIWWGMLGFLHPVKFYFPPNCFLFCPSPVFFSLTYDRTIFFLMSSTANKNSWEKSLRSDHERHLAGVHGCCYLLTNLGRLWFCFLGNFWWSSFIGSERPCIEK